MIGVARVRTGEHELEALLHQLVRAADKVQAVDAVELCRDARAEEPARAARADRPGVDVLGVAPHEVAEGALVGDLANALDGAHLQAALAEGSRPWQAALRHGQGSRHRPRQQAAPGRACGGLGTGRRAHTAPARR